jgi:hypothetical protein
MVTVFVLGFAFGFVLALLMERIVVPWLAHRWATRRRAHGWR